MNSIIIKKYKYNLIKSIGLFLIAFIIYKYNRTGYNYFVYILGVSAILSGLMHSAAGIENTKQTTENRYLVISGLITIVGTIAIMFYLRNFYAYYSNKVMLSCWLSFQIIYAISYLVVISKINKRQFSILSILLTGLIFLTIKAFLNNKSSFSTNFTLLPIAFVGILNLYVFYIFRKHIKISAKN
ncbi:hypothetical protein OO013_16990 [Mangrovivirga sp. M17]|uniref:DUF2339 domain-containing protein n=1 Tax=Mangrovivirga halotolerans TaxID=2993936 RepID=A0ABT3RUZ2_9BACT|nr:hypothetical protein [Mangrovivirga halotolerans]MCX2745580.1 hypothetical protein [Mangrovivirga halotolerans]